MPPAMVTAASSYHDGKFFSNFRRFLKRASTSVHYDPTIPYVLNTEALDKEAPEWAQAIATQWADKLEGKLGKDATGVTCHRHSDSDFTFEAGRQGHTLVVRQQRVYKISSLGTPFYQFPARMYVDGKPMPEAKVKALFKGDKVSLPPCPASSSNTHTPVTDMR